MTEQPLPLSYPTQPNPPARPRRNHPAVVEAALQSLAPEVIEWLADEFDPKEQSVESVADDLRKAVQHSYDLNGFEIGKALERYAYWSGVDAALVEILDSFESHLWSARDDAVKAWVSANGVVPPFPVGTKVSTPWGVGTITYLHPETAQYVVQTPDWAREHPDQVQHPRSGTLVSYEDCKLVENVGA